MHFVGGLRLGVDQGASVLEAVPGAVYRADLRAVCEMPIHREGGVSGGDPACQVQVIRKGILAECVGMVYHNKHLLISNTTEGPPVTSIHS